MIDLNGIQTRIGTKQKIASGHLSGSLPLGLRFFSGRHDAASCGGGWGGVRGGHDGRLGDAQEACSRTQKWPYLDKDGLPEALD